MTAAARNTNGNAVAPLSTVPVPEVQVQVVTKSISIDSGNHLKRRFDEDAEYDIKDIARCVDNHSDGFNNQQRRIRKLKAHLKKQVERADALEKRIVAMETAGRLEVPMCQYHKTVWDRLHEHSSKLSFIVDWLFTHYKGSNDLWRERAALLKQKFPGWMRIDDKKPQS